MIAKIRVSKLSVKTCGFYFTSCFSPSKAKTMSSIDRDMLLGGIFQVLSAFEKRKNFYRHPTHMRARSLTLNSQIHADYLKIHMENIHAGAWFFFCRSRVCLCHWINEHSHNRKFDITIVDIYAACNNVTHVSHCYLSLCACVCHYYYYTIRTYEHGKKAKQVVQQRERNTAEMRYKEKRRMDW